MERGCCDKREAIKEERGEDKNERLFSMGETGREGEWARGDSTSFSFFQVEGFELGAELLGRRHYLRKRSFHQGINVTRGKTHGGNTILDIEVMQKFLFPYSGKERIVIVKFL